MVKVHALVALLVIVAGCTQMNLLEGYEMQQRIEAWKEFLSKPEHRWQQLIAGRPSRNSNCGVVYELENFLADPNEGFAIVDMRNLAFAEPHYHKHDEMEIYIVLQGSACVVVGNQERQVSSGDVIVTPANTAHYVIPDEQFVIAVINTPPFDRNKYVKLHATDKAVAFDYEQFARLVYQSRNGSEQ